MSEICRSFPEFTFSVKVVCYFLFINISFLYALTLNHTLKSCFTNSIKTTPYLEIFLLHIALSPVFLPAIIQRLLFIKIFFFYHARSFPTSFISVIFFSQYFNEFFLLKFSSFITRVRFLHYSFF